ncbi:hypothetical protein AOLI_G00208720 [Acnodon oligacanthus]
MPTLVRSYVPGYGVICVKIRLITRRMHLSARVQPGKDCMWPTERLLSPEEGWVFWSGHRGDSWVPALLMPEPGAVRIMAGLRATGITDYICLLAMENPSYVSAFH